ncbi:uncharacterized protein LTR77_003696 [Saxophila tyrrhenica]|uniref:AB hydrolase-1 domain-containing protein n=1 Tax=Saxophila tyrrhenica TaxID=1690608 RepID=A0AAV9PIP4_9PEZI|nr:hypothetical protein LTR77_003696 [Saxophila tyrrhenica]
MAQPKGGAWTWPKPEEGDFIINDFQFSDGNNLKELRIHYRTLGRLEKDEDGRATNAVLIMHGTTGNSANFFKNVYAGELFNPGQLLDAEKYYLILPDGIGHAGSTKPSNGLRNQFPRYGYRDMVRAQHMLLTQHLGVDHLRLVTGTSMGGMHTWLWGVTYPDFMDALFPLASLPAQIAGRNRMIRKHAIDSIRTDPGFADGNYEVQPRGFDAALHVLAWMSSAPHQWQKAASDRESADEFIDNWIEVAAMDRDANDMAYAFDASYDYDPRPGLRDIKAPLTAVNFACDQVNPPELRILEEEIKNVKNGPMPFVVDVIKAHKDCWKLRKEIGRQRSMFSVHSSHEEPVLRVAPDDMARSTK